MISIWKPLPTQRPWSGGSSENCLPPLARRLCRWLRPSNELRTDSGPELETPTPAASGARGTLGAVCSIERLRLTPKTCELPAPLESPAGVGPSSFGCTCASGAGADGELEVVPVERICRTTPVLAATVAAGTATAMPASTANTPKDVVSLRFTTLASCENGLSRRYSSDRNRRRDQESKTDLNLHVAAPPEADSVTAPKQASAEQRWRPTRTGLYP